MLVRQSGRRDSGTSLLSAEMLPAALEVSQPTLVRDREARYFRDWPAVVAFLLETLPQLDGSGDTAEVR